MGSGLPRRDVGIIIAVASLLAGGIVAAAMVLPGPESRPRAADDGWLEDRDAASVPPAVADDPPGILPNPHLFPIPDARLARQP